MVWAYLGLPCLHRVGKLKKIIWVTLSEWHAGAIFLIYVYTYICVCVPHMDNRPFLFRILQCRLAFVLVVNIDTQYFQKSTEPIKR